MTEEETLEISAEEFCEEEEAPRVEEKEDEMLTLSRREFSEIMERERREALEVEAEEREQELQKRMVESMEAHKLKLEEIEEELVRTKALAIQEHIQRYLDDSGLRSLPGSVSLESVEDAKDFVRWLSGHQMAGEKTALKPFGNPMPHRLSEDDVRKRESDRFLKNIFPWLG